MVGEISILASFGLLLANTSRRAGAHWRSHAAKADLEQQQWDMETYNHWLEIIRNEQGEIGLSGLAVRPISK
jgi:D-amino-acid oxidase